MTFGSLFAGIGGIDVGLERAGLQSKWQVEQDGYALRVLEKHWPDIARYRDVRYFLGSKRWRRTRAAWNVDVIAGGFPCQDISNAGKRAGITGSRSGLWSEFARIIRLLRPRYVLVENVPALTVRGLNRVLGDLAELGFDAEWDRIPAAAVGAPHLRWRIFILAYAQNMRRASFERIEPDGVGELLATDANRNGRKPWRAANAEEGEAGRQPDRSVVAAPVSDADGERREELHVPALAARAGLANRILVPDAIGRRELQPQGSEREQRGRAGDASLIDVPDSKSRWSGQLWREQFAAFCEGQRNLYWPDPEPWLRRLDDGLSPTMDGVVARVDKLRCFGNAVVPSLPQWIGECLMELES